MEGRPKMRLLYSARPLRSGAACLVAGLSLTALPVLSAQAQNAPVTITIDVAANRRPISPLIYGMNYADANLSDLNCPIHRQGGNNLSRYNWKINADNRGNDWYYESIPETSATPSGRYFAFVDNNKAAGTESMVTVSTIGWVGKLGANRAKTASFRVSKYGAQKSVDPWWKDAGNGVRTDGTKITANPNDANVPSGLTFQTGFVNSLISRYGLAASGGVRYYLMDNEPALWYATHRDVHPTGAKMDEIYTKIRDYGKMVKTQDPGAIICGPEEWGWTGYFYSGYDSQYGGLHGWSYLPDRVAHGNRDFIPWLLQSLKADETASGKRALDVLSLHYYPQGGEFSNNISTTMQLQRNRSTRSLWDVNYVDYSWINQKIYLIPRMKQWVNSYYPGLKTAITEYSWGADAYASGAIAQADVFGIFGREGVDIATRWTAPSKNTPTYNAIKMYRNYDGAKSSFGDVSVSASGPNPDVLAAFASQDSATGSLKVMFVSKALMGDTPVTMNLSNFVAAGGAQVYQWTGATNAITRLPDLTTSTFSVPPQSITLIVVPGQ